MFQLNITQHCPSLSPLTSGPHSIVPNQPKYNQQLVQCYLIPSYPLYHIYSTIGTKLLSNLHEIAFENMQHKNPTPASQVNMCGQIHSPGDDTILDLSVPLLPAHSPKLIQPLYIYVTL